MNEYDDIQADGMVDDNSALIKECEDMFQESEQWMETKRNRWRLNEKLLANNIEVPGPKNNTKMKFNIALAVVQTQIPIMADYFPTFDILPREENDVAFADMMQKRKHMVEQKAKLKKHGLACCLDSLNYSNGLTRALPVFKDQRFTGVDIRPQDIFTWFPAPDARGMDIRTEARYHIFATPLHIKEVKRQYGVDVQPEGNIDKYGRFVVDTDRTHLDSKSSYALVKECYRMDEDESAYPHGRLTIWAGDTVITDEALWGTEVTEDDDWKRIPYFMISNYKNPHAIIGIGEPELVATQVKALNQVMSSIADNINYSGNPVPKITRAFKAAYGSVLRFVTGKPIEVNRPDDVTWMTPPSIPAYTFNFIDKMLQLVDIVTGVHDVTEGRKPSGITAASAITALQEAAQARIRYKVSNEVNEYVEDIGKYMVGLLHEYDEEVQMIRIATESGDYDFREYDPVHAFDEEGRRQDDPEFDPTTARSMQDSRFDIEVVAGTRTPGGQFAAEQVAAEKFTNGIYGIEEYVMNSSESDKRSVIEGWYRRQGLAELKEKQEALGDAEDEFIKLIDSIQEGEQWEGSRQEEQAGEIIQQFPELLSTDAFMLLPPAVKDRLLSVFVGADEANGGAS